MSKQQRNPKLFPKKFATCALPIIFFAASICRAECGADNPEVFEEFLARFSTEKPFAIERTRLPLRVIKWSDGVDIEGRAITEPQRFDLSLSEYWHWPTLGEYIKSNGLQSHIKQVSATKQQINLFRNDIRQTVTYHFELNEGCWLMTQYNAKSI